MFGERETHIGYRAKVLQYSTEWVRQLSGPEVRVWGTEAVGQKF